MLYMMLIRWRIKLCEYVKQFSSNTGTSRTDRQTDRIAISISRVSVLTRDNNVRDEGVAHSFNYGEFMSCWRTCFDILFQIESVNNVLISFGCAGEHLQRITSGVIASINSSAQTTDRCRIRIPAAVTSNNDGRGGPGSAQHGHPPII